MAILGNLAAGGGNRGLTGRVVAVILGFVLMLAGLIVSVTVVGLIVGVPMILLGVILVIRGLF